MRLKTLPAFLVALLLLLSVACKSGGDSSSNQPAGNGDDSSDALVLSASEALGRSAEDFEDAVESLEGSLVMDMTMGEASFGMRGDFAFQSPDRMQMTMEFTGASEEIISLGDVGSMEILVIGEDIYINMGLFGGWLKTSFDDMGADAGQFRELLAGQSPLDYTGLVEQLGSDVQVQDLGEDDLEGRDVRHYRISSDFATLMGAMDGALSDDLATGAFPLDGGLDGPVVMDIWLETESLLPYKVTAEGAFVVDSASEFGLGGDMAFSMTMVVDEYNGDVSFPEPPADAIDISELSGEMFSDPEGFE